MPGKRLRNPFRAERLGGFLPFFWYGTRMRDWRRLLAAGRYELTANRLPNMLGVTLLSPVSSAMHHLSEAVYRRRAEAVEIQPPLFVLGHWRSGTTFLHNLLTQDVATAYPTTYECVFPGGFLLTERRSGWMLSPFLPAKRPMDEVPLSRDTPFEDEFALAKLGVGSPYAGMLFPDRPPDMRYLDLGLLTVEEREAWAEGMIWLMRRLQLQHPGRRLILKSPPHTARIATLLRLFPDARFVHVSRDPFEIYPSTLRLWKILNSRFGLTNPATDDRWLPEHVLSTLPPMYEAYRRDRALVAAGRLAEIRYEDLAADPRATIAALYGRLDLGDFAAVAPDIDRYLAGLKPHIAARKRQPAGERAVVADRWGLYFDLFGYPREV